MNPFAPGFVFIWDGFLCKVIGIIGNWNRVVCYDDNGFYGLDVSEILRILGRP